MAVHGVISDAGPGRADVPLPGALQGQLTSDPGSVARGRFSHDLLIHDNNDDFLAATAAFVDQGLRNGGRVLVHSAEERAVMLRSALGTHPQLVYGFDQDLYLSPMSTLFRYERLVAESRNAGELWVAETVPFGSDLGVHPAWARYESLINDVLGQYPFHALCSYDSRTLPASTIADARATHPCIINEGRRAANPAYVEPATFLADPRAETPHPPAWPPTSSATLHGTQDLRPARHLVVRNAAAASAVDPDAVDGFLTAVNEVLGNGLRHGRPPVELRLWVQAAKLTCLVTDAGSGIANPLSGYRQPSDNHSDHGRGLWVARRLCEELIIRNTERGGCSVLITAARPR